KKMTNKPLKEVTIYTDGACINNPGPGGYGVVLLYGSFRKELFGGFRLTTNNRMEILAAVAGLEALNTRCKVTIYSDSELLVGAIGEGWAKKWRQKGWRKGKKWTPNADLWDHLLKLCDQHEVEIHWVKGHSNITENERADQLSYRAARMKDLAIDEPYEKGQTTMQPPTLF
ncbi:MAG: ribonuclease HI, partial [Candidatus Promineifilaceae bacterium]|nr:ribonuclease HI [Candidatus Promineifilaceae bacterium]